MDWTKLPKVELHLHLDCSLSYEVVSQIDPSITLEEYRTNFCAGQVCGLGGFPRACSHKLSTHADRRAASPRDLGSI